MERFSGSQQSLIAAITMGALLVPLGARAERRDPIWENGRLTITRVFLEPGAALASGGDRILVHFSADADGRLPAEAVWQPAGELAIKNRGAHRVEALIIELKDAPESAVRSTSPESLTGTGLAVTTLIDNPRVLVLKHRYAPHASVARRHFHDEDVLLIYLRGGNVWPLDGSWGSVRVGQGEIGIVPAHTLHTLSNAGGDPLEMLVVIPR